MRDFAQKWSPAPNWRDAAIERPGWTAKPVHGLGQALVSGDIGKAKAALAADAPEIGLWAVAATDRCLVRTGRWQALFVTPAPVGLPSGWRDGGWTAGAADDAYLVVDIEGPEARQVVSEGVAADLDGGSRSAATLFAGTEVLIYRRAEERVRLHVDASFAPYLWRWLEKR